ncbi:RcnB family protein [Sphingobium bisphenolivorans]|uniref:RcnB family protein n=1 Tax=Sphingobium bisphenolivorans TaxID=1335760 RepID=UPI0003B32FCC|nr:RcnB family protein [Sphingobium bisphenolivorans]
MRFWSILLVGTGLTLACSAPASAERAAWSGAARPVSMGTGRMIAHRWGPLQNGRWIAGWRAPGGWAAYRRPVVGYVLPRYWISPAYGIANYGAYGLPVPASGYGWSRYYDDAVMTDRYGRVREVHSDIAWDHPDQDAPPPSGIGYDDEVTAPDSPPYGYEGRWTGTWRDEDGRVRSGEYEGRFEGRVSGGPGVDYDAPPYADSRWSPTPARPGDPLVTTTHAPGYIAGGYYHPGVTTTVVIQPAVTTTTSYVTEKVARRKGGARRSCHCK